MLVLDTAATIQAVSSFPNTGGKGILYHGEGSESYFLDILLHLFVNILGAIVLSASIYVMQCRSSPTHEEVDEAHSKREGLRVGVLNIRNSGGLCRARFILCSMLAGRSLRVHFI